VGLMANATIAAFDNIIFHPTKDPGEHPQMPIVNAAEAKIEESSGKVNQQGSLLKDLYKICSVDNPTPEDKELYCQNLFPD